MPIVQLIVLAAIQGITEFLPISSSAHLILAPKLTGMMDQGLMLDVIVHVGTLLAVMIYFWRDIFAMTAALAHIPRQIVNRRNFNVEYWLFLKLIVATLPVFLTGFLVNYYLGDILRSVEIIGWATLGFGLLLLIADRSRMTVRSIEHITFVGAFVVGIFQAFALIPGASRSGVTMTAARFLGVDRQSAAHFSILLSIPAILGAGALKGFELYQSDDPVLMGDAIIAGGLAFMFALIAIGLLMAWLKRASFTPFVFYRFALGAGLLYYAYGAPGFNLSG